MATQRFSQSHGIVPVEQCILGNWASGGAMDSVNMAKYNHATLIIIGGADCTTDTTLTVKAATTDAGTTANVTFSYRYSAGDIGAASADVLGAVATSSSLTVTAASLADRMLVVEWDAEDMNVSNVQYQYATPTLGTDGTDGEYSAVVILSEPRYEETVMHTAVPTA